MIEQVTDMRDKARNFYVGIKFTVNAGESGKVMFSVISVCQDSWTQKPLFFGIYIGLHRSCLRLFEYQGHWVKFSTTGMK